jgi:pimeloyl-ACP methyl ester carboxylesterase
MGYSTFQPDRQLLDWPGNVVDLADALGIDRFAVQGASGGGPYALACAFKIPDRVRGCGILAGLGPIDRFGTVGMMRINRLQFGVSRALPVLLRPLFATTLGRYRRYVRDDAGLERAAAALAERRPGLPPATATDYLRETVEAFRQGSRGAAYDAFLFARPWGFALENIACPVYLWHGGSDRHVPVEMARGVAAKIPDCRAHFIEGQDHMTTILSCLTDSLSALTSQ